MFRLECHPVVRYNLCIPVTARMEKLLWLCQRCVNVIPFQSRRCRSRISVRTDEYWLRSSRPFEPLWQNTAFLSLPSAWKTQRTSGTSVSTDSDAPATPCLLYLSKSSLISLWTLKPKRTSVTVQLGYASLGNGANGGSEWKCCKSNYGISLISGKQGLVCTGSVWWWVLGRKSLSVSRLSSASWLPATHTMQVVISQTICYGVQHAHDLTLCLQRMDTDPASVGWHLDSLSLHLHHITATLDGNKKPLNN